jgi:ribosomal protein L7/L12
MQVFDVRLLDIGPNRLPVLARVRPLLDRPPAECRELLDAGNILVASGLVRDKALNLASELEQLGAHVEIEVSPWSACDHLDASTPRGDEPTPAGEG